MPLYVEESRPTMVSDINSQNYGQALHAVGNTYPRMYAYDAYGEWRLYCGIWACCPLPEELTYTPVMRVNLSKPPELNQETLEQLWRVFRNAGGYYGYNRQSEFANRLSELARVPDGFTLQWCLACRKPLFDDVVECADGVTCGECDENNNHTCEDCGDRVYYCNYAGDTAICTVCTERHYQWCENCDTYVHNDDTDEHTHGRCSAARSGECEVDTYALEMPNDGEPNVKQDERITVTLPAGIIDEAGLRKIKGRLANADIWLADSVWDGVGAQWQTKRGNFTRRLSSAAYQTEQKRFDPDEDSWVTDKVRIPSDVLSDIGCIARDHSGTTSSWSIEFTRDLNMSAEDFYHAESCWWGGYESSRCWLKHNGGLGVRTFRIASLECDCNSGEEDSHVWSCSSLDDDAGVSGRAWILPLKRDARDRLRPTFNTLTPDAYVCFNAYGELSQYNAARLLSHMAGMTYRKIEFAADPMYVNAGGVLVSSQEICDATERLNISADAHNNLFELETIGA